MYIIVDIYLYIYNIFAGILFTYVLKNVHLVPKWLPTLHTKMEASFENPHNKYRIFITAEPAADPLYQIPQVFAS